MNPSISALSLLICCLAQRSSADTYSPPVRSVPTVPTFVTHGGNSGFSLSIANEAATIRLGESPIAVRRAQYPASSATTFSSGAEAVPGGISQPATVVTTGPSIDDAIANAAAASRAAAQAAASASSAASAAASASSAAASTAAQASSAASAAGSAAASANSAASSASSAAARAASAATAASSAASAAAAAANALAKVAAAGSGAGGAGSGAGASGRYPYA